MTKIYYVGDWAVQCGPVYAETPFSYAFKGLETINYGKWLKEALESDNKNSVHSVPTWDFYALAPGEYEKILTDYDVIIFSDVELKNFHLNPSFFNHKLFGTKVLTFPDRVRLTVESVEAGMRIMFLGGWLSFSGEIGKGGWGRSRLAEILPVRCLEGDDLVESTEGFTPELTTAGKATYSDIALSSFPPILGYNKTLPKEGCETLATVNETGDPLIAAGKFGKGKTLAYTSDPAPHWGCNFVFWEDYTRFWLRSLEELLTE